MVIKDVHVESVPVIFVNSMFFLLFVEFSVIKL